MERRAAARRTFARRDFLAGAGALTLLTACGGGKTATQPTPGASPVRGGHISEAFPYAASTLNPVIMVRLTDQFVCSLCYDGLVAYGGDGQLVPQLAASIPQPSSDGLTYTFQLRSGMRWTDGSPITADDVVFTYQLHSAPQYQLVRSFIRSAMDEFLASVSAPAQDKVVFKLKKPNAAFIASYCTYGVVPKHVWGSFTADQVNTSPYNITPKVTSGPFTVSNHTLGSSITFQRNPTYHGGAPHFDTYALRFVTDDSARVNQVKTGEADIAIIPPASVAAMQSTRSVRLVPVTPPTITVCYFQLDPAKSGSAVLGDKRVRQALAYAADIKAMVASVYYGQAVSIDTTLVPPVSWAYDPNLKPQYPHDVGQAKKLLDQAGWKEGSGGVRQKNGAPLKFDLWVGPRADWESMGQILQQAWRQVGADVTIRQEQTAQLSLRVLDSRDFDAIINDFGWISTDPDMSNIITAAANRQGSNNGSDYRNPEVDRLVSQAVTTSDRNARKRLYGQIQHIVAEDEPQLPLVSSKTVYAINQRVQGLEIGPYTSWIRNGLRQAWVSDGK